MISEKWLYAFNILLSRFINALRGRPGNPHTILCVKWDEIGDMATCTHVFSLLRKRYPEAEITVLTKPWSAGLILFDPNVDEILTDINAWKGRYDLVLELRGTWNTLYKSIRYMPMHRMDRGWVRLRQRGAQPHETLTNYRIAEPVLNGLPNESPGLFCHDENRKLVNDFLGKSGIQTYCVIHAGARRKLRQWPVHEFAALADWLYEEKGLTAVFAGTPEEEPQIREITGMMKRPYALFTNNFSLCDLMALMERATLFVGNESGPLQMADALKLPLVALFGPGVPHVFYPQNPKARVLHVLLECNPCDQVHCVHPDSPCISRISQEQARQAILSVL